MKGGYPPEGLLCPVCEAECEVLLYPKLSVYCPLGRRYFQWPWEWYYPGGRRPFTKEEAEARRGFLSVRRERAV
jgi:hypothetical protein